MYFVSTPLVRGTIKQVSLSWSGASGLVTAYTINQSAPSAPTINLFCPEMTQSPPTLRAFVVVPKKSEPPRGSVRHSAAQTSPFSSGMTISFFSSSSPNSTIASATMSPPTPQRHAKE